MGSEQSVRQGGLGTLEEPFGGLEVSERAHDAKHEPLRMAEETGNGRTNWPCFSRLGKALPQGVFLPLSAYREDAELKAGGPA